MKRSEQRLLLNAEPFGFGPTAAIASFFPYLRERFSWIGYVGSGHTLDLQRMLPYDEIIDATGRSGPAEARLMTDLAEHYDLFFTALDFRLADLARQAGLVTCLYDPITWFWKEIPASARHLDLYIAQNFIGVEARLERERDRFPRTILVPAIVEPKAGEARTAERVLVNLGGLQNPFWTVPDATAYAREIIRALRLTLPNDPPIAIATSKAIADALNDPDVRPYGRTEMEGLMQTSAYAFMTPGLGNIYDSAGHDLPTAWLPAANDSQGQQADLLEDEGLCDARLDWKTILPEQPFSYWDEQGEVLKRITAAVRELAMQPEAQRRLQTACKEAIATLKKRPGTNGSALLTRFGSGGARQVAEAVSQLAETESAP